MKLLIVGAGHLGASLIPLINEFRPRTEVTAVTASDKRHEALLLLGVEPRLASDFLPNDFDRIVISVPPSRVENPIGFLTKWSGHLNATGKLWLVSSTGVYPQTKSGDWVDESSGVDPQHPLVAWENFCLERGFGVLRLAGLYDTERGPHRVYQRSTVRSGYGGEYVNLIHTQDAARALLECVSGGKVLLRIACDGEPVTRDRLASLAAEMIGQKPPCRFSDSSGPLGKRVRSIYPLHLRYGSFPEWVKEQVRAL